MAESNKDGKSRIIFPKGKQRVFMLKALEYLDSKALSAAKILKVSERTIREWKNENYTLPAQALVTLCRVTKLPRPIGIQIRNQYAHTSKAGRKGGLAILNKFGRIGGDPEIRKKKWRQWWKRTGQFSKHPILYVTKPFKTPRKSKELAEFIGIMMGDGGLSINQLTITLHRVDDKEFAKYVCKQITSLFHVQPSIYHPPESAVNIIAVSRRGLIQFLHRLGLPVGDKIRANLDIPDWIKQSPSFSIACVRGLVDTDGCIFQNKYTVNGKSYSYCKLSFKSASLPLRNSVYTILRRLGMQPSLSTYRDVRLNSRTDVKRYFKIIGSKNSKHLKKFRKYFV